MFKKSFKIAKFVDFWIDVALLAFMPVVLLLAQLSLTDEAVKLISNSAVVQHNIQAVALWIAWALNIPFIILSILKIKRTKSLSDLTEEVETLKIYKREWTKHITTLVDGYLLWVANHKLKFEIDAVNSDRISLYIYDQAGVFLTLGRYSTNPHFGKKQIYNVDEMVGCVSQAWQLGFSFIDGMSDHKIDMEKYADEHVQNGMKINAASKLKMRSRIYFAQRIENPLTKFPIAVLVVESTDPKRFSLEKLQKIFNKDEEEYLYSLIAIIKEHAPSLNEAVKKRF